MVTFNTTEYEFSHGRKPRGTGLWGFQRPGSDEIVWINGSLTEAKAELRSEHGGGEWIVCP